MQRRLILSLRAFQISLVILLLAGVLTAAAWRYASGELIRLCNGAIVGAAAVACVARCWQWRLQQTIDRTDFAVGPGHYDTDPLSDRRFTV